MAHRLEDHAAPFHPGDGDGRHPFFIWTYDDFLGPPTELNNSNTAPLALRVFVDSTVGEPRHVELSATSALSPALLVFLPFRRLVLRSVATGELKR